MDKGDKGKNLLTIGKASEYLGVSIDTLRRWEKKRRIEPLRSPGGHRYFLKEDLDRLFGKKYTHDEAAEKVVKKEAVEKIVEKSEQITPTQTYASINYPTLEPKEESTEIDRPVRDIKIPEVKLIRIIKTSEDTKIVGSEVQEVQKQVVATSILTPPAPSQNLENSSVEYIQNTQTTPGLIPETKVQEKTRVKNNNIKIYIAILVAVIFLTGFVFFMIGASSQEILSPVP